MYINPEIAMAVSCGRLACKVSAGRVLQPLVEHGMTWQLILMQ